MTRSDWIIKDRALPGATWIVAFFVGIMTAVFFYDADIFWQDTGFVFGVAATVCFFGWRWSSVKGLHPLYTYNNPAIGMARLGVIGAVLWCAYTLTFHGDPTLVGMWFVLYAVMAYAAIKFFGQRMAQFFGPRLRVDVYERRNLPAAVFIAAFTFSTGLIFGGAMWGDLESGALEYGAVFEVLPGYEDGWWITPWFFLMGWLILLLTMVFWLKREKADVADRVVRDRRMGDAKAAGSFCISIAIIITYAVQGDYHGFADSLMSFSLIALPVLAHELIRPKADQDITRDGESWLYIVAALAGVLVMPWLSGLLGFRL